WVDDLAPPWTRPWLRLSRADRPIGTWLLLIPCWWAVALAAVAEGWAWWDLWLFAGAGIGAFLMRGAGCTWNDFTDRKIDAAVARTRSRPLPSGQVSPVGALAWCVAQSLAAFLILLSFGWPAIGWGVGSLALVAVYPFAKRFTWWPQIFLGLAFNWGALLLWVASTGGIGLAPVLLYLAGIAWTLHYDTIYAHQDREDDELVGVKSTARLFGEDTGRMLWLFTALAGGLAALAVLAAGGGWPGLIGVAAFALHLAWQVRALDIDDDDRCLKLFRSNRTAGLLLLAGLLADSVI
ncbi:MAG TPA: 4-hydroxybenzoate octaprenyltransferase, partial [Paracoccaceae bacterium]|nr:4-hydroxybenzoate octaprenyltransferase [Paracoccaceae bacterium]